jgi:hypothetical protein
MVISDALSGAWDESCVTLTYRAHEGLTWEDPMGNVFAESDGMIWQLDAKESEYCANRNRFVLQ